MPASCVRQTGQPLSQAGGLHSLQVPIVLKGKHVGHIGCSLNEDFVVEEVHHGGFAEHHGIRKGAKLSKVNGKPVEDVDNDDLVAYGLLKDRDSDSDDDTSDADQEDGDNTDDGDNSGLEEKQEGNGGLEEKQEGNGGLEEKQEDEAEKAQEGQADAEAEGAASELEPSGTGTTGEEAANEEKQVKLVFILVSSSRCTRERPHASHLRCCSRSARPLRSRV